MTKRLNTRGLTLIELMIASVILMTVITIVMTAYANFTSSKRRVLLTNQLYNETNFLMERIAREIHNGTIDYQGYWKENALMNSADEWIEEGANPSGVKSDGDTSAPSTPGFNSIKNCQNPTSLSDTISDTNSTEQQKDILMNYRYQFIYPGAALPDGNDNLNNMVHLNCESDNFNTGAGYNVYDDDAAYGQGPRAFSENPYDSASNQSLSSKMLWDWDLNTINPITENNPPLLLVKENSDKTEYTRSALRLKNKKIELIQFLGKDTDTAPPDFIADQWKCSKDFACGNTNKSYDGSYIWSQKEVKRTAGDTNLGLDNGINSVSDTDLVWKDITPANIQINRFDFILSPVKDPHRAFFEKTRIQKPQVTFIIEAQVKTASMKGVSGEAPKIILQTTVTPRIWDLIEIDN